MAIESFADEGSRDVFDGRHTRAAARRCPSELARVAQRKLDALNSARTLHDFMRPPGNHLEALSGNRKGQHSIRLNDRYRICFYWTGTGASGVELVDYH
jgi:proteic killer suppression protein